MRFRSPRAPIVALLFAAAACGGAPVDLKQTLEVANVTTGWFDAGIKDGKNWLLPTVSLRLKNTGGRTISMVQLNAVFRRAGEQEEWDATLTKGVDQSGLEPGQLTPSLTVRSKTGYTSEQPRAEMLLHSQFRDFDVRVFAKRGASQWVLLGEYPIQRQLLTQ
ncbi:MAG: hypothetical protein LC804_24150 [Acidobacteria bacterium]|nr:hypothetical protein [Acidobacteriota bacterium]